MIVVKIELHSAITKQITEIGRMIIANEGTTGGDTSRGNYTVKLARRGHETNQLVWDRPQKEARVLDYPRLSYPVWVLVARALKALGIMKDGGGK